LTQVSIPRTRRFPRVQAEHSALVRLLGGQPIEEFARTRVVGLGGCMFLSEEPLGFGSLLEVLIAMEGRVLRTDARVVYEIPREDLRHEVGVEFLRVSPGDRALLENLVARKAAGGATPRYSRGAPAP
jgi:PilZ domain-containing protein